MRIGAARERRAQFIFENHTLDIEPRELLLRCREPLSMQPRIWKLAAAGYDRSRKGPLRIHPAGLYRIYRPNREQPPSRRQRRNYPTLPQESSPLSTASTCPVRTNNGSEEHNTLRP